MKAVIVTGGKKPSKSLLKSYLEKDDFIIGVDSGCNCLYEYKVYPDIIMGDFDSAHEEAIRFLEEKNIKKVSFNTDKDYSDTQLAYEKAKELGYKNIILFGATGSRLDHSLGNIGLLFDALKNKIDLEIIDDNNRIFFIDKPTTLQGDYGQTLSFMPMSYTVSGVTIEGAKYLLDDYDMTILEPRAISNEFLNKDITISFRSGIIMVIYSRD